MSETGGLLVLSSEIKGASGFCSDLECQSCHLCNSQFLHFKFYGAKFIEKRNNGSKLLATRKRKRQFAENNCCLYNIYNIQVNLNIKKMLFIISVWLVFFFEIYIES